ncbi:MAG: hypothetical protein ACLQVF_23910 [Isosphaeraceae bacterium]
MTPTARFEHELLASDRRGFLKSPLHMCLWKIFRREIGLASVVQYPQTRMVLDGQGGVFREENAMLRIARVDGGTSESIVTLRLEGKLLGPWVGELRRACGELHVPPAGLSLNLSAVTFIDAAGVELLGALMSRGATIDGCKGFIAELLNLSETSSGDDSCVRC